jgi:large subunit ribosomal protein L13
VESTAKITKSVRKEDVEMKWWIVDAEGQTLGRLASKVAFVIRGKHKPLFTPHVDCGDFVIVTNIDKVKLEGKRTSMKEYFTHSGYPGKAKYRSFTELMQNNPEYVIRHAVKGMLPKNKLGRVLNTKLKCYKGTEHPHYAQKPQALSLTDVK